MTGAPATTVIVAFNAADSILDTLETARRCWEQGMAECVVVDNASSDGTPELIKRRHPWVNLIESSENLGFGRGCNLGFEHVETPFVLLLNPDAILEPKDLGLLLDFMAGHPEAGVAAPAARSPRGGLQLYGDLPSPWQILRAAAPGPLYRNPLREMDLGAPPRRSDWVCGAVLLIRSAAFRELGGFDPRFFLYFEETDLLRRAKDGGVQVWAVCEAVAIHAGFACASKGEWLVIDGCIADHFFRSRFYYLKKHHGLVAAAATELAELGLLTAASLGRRLLGRGREGDLDRWKAPILKVPERVEAAPGRL